VSGEFCFVSEFISENIPKDNKKMTGVILKIFNKKAPN